MNSSVSLLDEYEGHLAHGVSREELLECADNIAPLPQAAVKVLNLLDNPDSGPSELAEAASTDPGLASTLLRVANSAAYVQAERVSSVELAVTTVGYSKLRSIVLGSSLRSMGKREALDQLVWENSLATAMIGRRLAATLMPGRRMIFS